MNLDPRIEKVLAKYPETTFDILFPQSRICVTLKETTLNDRLSFYGDTTFICFLGGSANEVLDRVMYWVQGIAPPLLSDFD